jgi:beta-aspartyl-peptidase (threonine type)
MKLPVILAVVCFTALCAFTETPAPTKSAPFRIVIHGGAGNFTSASMSPEREKALRDTLAEALMKGESVLENNGSSVDAVVAAINVLEDSGLFNTGKGSTLTSAGTAEVVAGIMDGSNLKAGAVADLKHVKNPITLARLVMDKSPHVLLIGEGAEAFAQQQGMKLVGTSYFASERKLEALKKAQEKQGNTAPKLVPVLTPDSHDTVGVVALDKAGHLAAGTSSGGITNQWVGRVGDSPIIGAGNYANDKTCAVSATGEGEYFIRTVAAHDISALMEYKGMNVKDAANAVMKKIADLGGQGGFIVLDPIGNFTTPFNTTGMMRGYVGADGKPVIEFYHE